MMIDFSTPDGFCSESIDGQTLVNNASGLAKAVKIFNVPTALLHESDISQLSSESFNQMIDMISELFIVDPETA